MLGLLQLMVAGGFISLVVFMVLIAMPQSRLRDALKPFVLAFVCFLYVISPLDVVPEIFLGPFGLVDDAGVGLTGFAAVLVGFLNGIRQLTAKKATA